MEIYGLSFIYEWLEKNSYVLLYLGVFSFCIFFMSIFGIKYFAAKIPQITSQITKEFPNLKKVLSCCGYFI